jgi:hypothetical protein
VPGPGRLCRLPGTLARCQDWRDSHLRFRFDDQLQPLPDIGDLLREADRDPIAVVGREPVQAEASGQRRDLTLPLPVGACPRSLFPWVVTAPGSRGLRGIIPGNPRAVTLPKWLRVTCPSTLLGPLDPTPAPTAYCTFFRIFSLSCGAPLRSRTVDLLLTIGVRSGYQSATLAKGQVRSSSLTRLGRVRERSRQMRPPRFLPVVHGGAACLSKT